MCYTIQKYNESYTEDENRIIHEFLTNADDDTLIDAITQLYSLYSPDNKTRVQKEFHQLSQEIRMRYEMKQRFDILLKCKESWGKYLDKIQNYNDSRLIRDKYNHYKKNHFSTAGLSLLDMFIENQKSKPESLCKMYSKEFIRKCTFSEQSKHGIKLPEKPSSFFSSLEEITIKEIKEKESLKYLGRENLIYLLTCLLYLLGTSHEDGASAIIMMMTRKYSFRSHKKEEKMSFFVTSEKTYLELKEDCLKYLDEIKSYKEEAEEILKSISPK